MSEGDKSLIEKAFSADGPIFDGPSSKGRRKYDQTFWWVRVVKDVGFPIAAAWWIASRLLPVIENLEAAQNRNTAVMRALVCHLDPASCARILMDEKSIPGPSQEGVEP